MGERFKVSFFFSFLADICTLEYEISRTRICHVDPYQSNNLFSIANLKLRKNCRRRKYRVKVSRSQLAIRTVGARSPVSLGHSI